MNSTPLPFTDLGNAHRVTGTSPLLSADFAGECGNCGCQFGQLRCTKPECQGCTIEFENETCRHVFSHRLCDLPADRKPGDGFRPLWRIATRKLCRRHDLEACSLCSDGIHDETVSHAARPLGPDTHLAIRNLDPGQLIPEVAHSHPSSLRRVQPRATIAEAAQRGNDLSGLGGGGAAE